MTLFADVSKQIHLLDELILTEMISGKTDYYEESIQFSKHLLTTKYWYMRISWTNKKHFLLSLLEDVKSVWTLSLLLKSIWNCRPKDAVSSITEKQFWSSYDQVPLDNNRTVLPVSMLKQVMVNDREWFSTLKSDQQALVLSELLTVSGGPIMWCILSRTQQIFEAHREQQLQDMMDCVVLNEPPAEKTKAAPTEVKKETPRRKTSLNTPSQAPLPGQAQRELEINMATWNSTIKSIRDSFKLEEIEMVYKDGTKKTIWKVNRPKPESLETVDFIQLLPAIIAKRILLYVPQAQYADLSRVNRYWAFLIDEVKADMLARQKINMDIDKLREIILRHDQDLGMVSGSELYTNTSTFDGDTYHITSPISVEPVKKPANTADWRREVKRPPPTTLKPIRKMLDLYERLDRRGAADENMWKWCSNILKLRKKMVGHDIKKESEGLLPLCDLNFPCPLLVHSFKVPLEIPLIVDPTLK
ncbi:uncharacterized protein LOC119832509 [Zerene cesonia]|uniref:uncharacterized protein LOC119832509 n=1 Tax=Zerene cesonia TaxID=33412 RepID=UPI0018E53332|nr:uncharacterized protein LOC119832509 [Zerene cesonia]